MVFWRFYKHSQILILERKLPYGINNSNLPDMSTLALKCCAPSGLCMHIRQAIPCLCQLHIYIYIFFYLHVASYLVTISYLSYLVTRLATSKFLCMWLGMTNAWGYLNYQISIWIITHLVAKAVDLASKKHFHIAISIWNPVMGYINKYPIKSVTGLQLA